MLSRLIFCALCAFVIARPAPTLAQTTAASPASSPTFASLTPTGTGSSSSLGNGTLTNGTSTSTGTATTNGVLGSAPDVYLSVPTLGVGRIELDVDNLSADLNLNAQVASLVTINAGVQVSIAKVNLTISDVGAEVELVVRLGNLVSIVDRVFKSLDLNPLLINVLNDVTSVVTSVVGAVDGLLGSITQGGNLLNFIVDNLGNIVQELTDTAGNTVSTIVGNYNSNMTFTGVAQDLGNGLTQKTYEYSPLGALVDIVFNTLGQVVQATVVKQNSTSSATSTGAAGSTAAARRGL